MVIRALKDVWGLPGLTAAHRAPIEEPNWASNLSPRHAAVLSTPLIQSLPCHGGTGRALIQFTQQQKKKPQTHSSLPAEHCQLLDMTLSEKDEDNYRDNCFIFIMCSAYFFFPCSKLIALDLSQKPKVIAYSRPDSSCFNVPCESIGGIISMHLMRFGLVCNGQGGPQISHLD